MPIYVYRCQGCGFEFEVRQGFDDDKLDFCVSCSTINLQRVPQPLAAVIYRGGGWAREKWKLSPAYETGDGDVSPPALVKSGEQHTLTQPEYNQLAMEKKQSQEGTKNYPLKRGRDGKKHKD